MHHMKPKDNKRVPLRRSGADMVFDCFNHAFFVLVLLAVLYPLWLVLIASFSSSSAVVRGDVFLLPREFSLAGYGRIFSYARLWKSYGNTLLYTTVGTCLALVFTLPAAYALSKREFVGRRAVSGLFLFVMIFNGGLIPTFLAMKSYHLLNTMWAVILPGTLATYNLMLCRTYFESSIPLELWESAQLDGCTHTRFFISIAIPLSKAIISVMVLYYAVTFWNSYFNALIYLNTQSKYPLQIVLRQILLVNTADSAVMGDSNAVDELFQIMMTMKYGVIIVASVPIITLYLLVQKHFEKGVMLGAIKG